MLKTSSIKIILLNIICISCLYKFFNSFFLVNGPQALYVNPGCFKCISGINLSPPNKTYLLFHSFYTDNDDSMKLHSKQNASCSFIDFGFLLPHTALFDNNIGLPFFVFITFEFTFSLSFLHFKQYVKMFYND